MSYVFPYTVCYQLPDWLGLIFCYQNIMCMGLALQNHVIIGRYTAPGCIVEMTEYNCNRDTSYSPPVPHLARLWVDAMHGLVKIDKALQRLREILREIQHPR